ncbi:MAG TPA: VCBS repeat-containing protein, partial [Phycisphaerae bacterium]|nr:VCBS repeat-containing protein [Phycisphaerae bacterium]
MPPGRIPIKKLPTDKSPARPDYWLASHGETCHAGSTARKTQESNGINLKTTLAIWLGICSMFITPVQARPQFSSSEINGGNFELMVCDLDGDGLKDLVLLDNTNLSIFYQNPNRGFPREPQQTYSLEPRPCVIWPAKLGGPSDSILVMTGDGVSELSFTNRTGPPVIRQIIKQSTIIPDRTDEANAAYVPLSVATGQDWPLLLVPTVAGLQVWRHQ